jgi:acyl-CoA synthetase (AMP-forming)/AMP-acid ligase II
MQEIQFEATVKDGYIKIPERYSSLNNKKVVVDILDKDITIEEKEDRVKKVKEYLRKYSGILKNTKIPPDITIKEIREMRIKEKHGL